MTMPRPVKTRFEAYPEPVRAGLLAVRSLILEVVEQEELGRLEETLKWGEPAYLVKKGSTVRLGSPAKSADEFAVYFHCQSRLVESFRGRFGELFRYEGNRAIIFGLDDELPQNALRECLSLALRYHSIKKDL